MSKVYTSACVIIPPEEIWEPIQKIRRKYDRQINRWMPHINLFYPFIYESQFDKIVEDFKKICYKIEPFKIILRNFKFFQHSSKNSTIWIEPELFILIIQFQQQLLKIIPYCDDLNRFKRGFQPHLSVGQFNTQKINQTIQNLELNWTKLEFLLKKIFFISRINDRGSYFKIKMKIQLKS